METILTVWNAHRAATIKPINNPDSPELTFNWRAERTSVGMFSDRYSHTAVDPNSSLKESIDDNRLNEFIVCSWKYEQNFEDMKELAIRSFYSTSHTPEVRAAQYIRDYERQLQEDLKGLEPDFHSDYVSRYRDWVRELFDRHSRIMSAMITGPARFPTARNTKANSAYETAYEKFNDWRENFKKRALKRIEEQRSPEEKADREWTVIKRDIFSTASTLLGIDLKKPEYRGYSRTCFVTNLAGRMETLAKNGKVEMLRRAAEYIKSLNAQFKENGAKEIFTSRHKFWKLVEEAEAQVNAQEERANRENVEIEFCGGTVVKNYAENRLQIVYDDKPDRTTIDKLKKHGFRWSPSNGAWQRFLNVNSYYACADIVPVTVDQLR